MSMFNTVGNVSGSTDRKANTLRKLERMGAAINRIGEHYLECAKAEIDAGKGLLDGMFFSPTYWREYLCAAILWLTYRNFLGAPLGK